MDAALSEHHLLFLPPPPPPVTLGTMRDSHGDAVRLQDQWTVLLPPQMSISTLDRPNRIKFTCSVRTQPSAFLQPSDGPTQHILPDVPFCWNGLA